MYFIFFSDCGTPKRRGAWGNLPLLPPALDGFAQIHKLSGGSSPRNINASLGLSTLFSTYKLQYLTRQMDRHADGRTDNATGAIAAFKARTLYRAM